MSPLSENALALVVASCLFQGAGQALQKAGISVRLPSLSVGSMVKDFRGVARTLGRSAAWLGGLACMLAGGAIGVQAMAYGDLSFVMPLSNLTMVATVLIGVTFLRESLGAREWCGVLLLLAGSAALAVGEPSSAAARPPSEPPVTILVVSVLGAALGILLGERRRRANEREMFLAMASGILFGVSNLLLKLATAAVREGQGAFRITSADTLLGLALEPATFLALAGLAAGFLLLQTAYSNGRISIVYPLKTILAVSFGVALGVIGLGERLGSLRTAGVVATIGGMILIGVGSLASRTARPPSPLAKPPV
jgi:drug/metabolite transporter (DMT)-like permease